MMCGTVIFKKGTLDYQTLNGKTGVIKNSPYDNEEVLMINDTDFVKKATYELIDWKSPVYSVDSGEIHDIAYEVMLNQE